MGILLTIGVAALDHELLDQMLSQCGVA